MFPFEEDILVYKILNKMIAVFSLNSKEAEHFIVLKCDLERTVKLREKFQDVTKEVYAGNSLIWIWYI